MTDIGRSIISILLGIGALLLIGYSFIGLLETRGRDKWPTAEATIVSNRIEEWRRRRSSTPSYIPHVTYSFHVDGVPQRGKAIRLIPETFFERSDAEKYLQSYAIGSKHTAYYNPDNPTHAYLDPDDGGVDWCIMSIPVGLFVFALVIWPWKGPDPDSRESLLPG